MMVRILLIIASLACSAEAIAGDAASHAAPGQPAVVSGAPPGATADVRADTWAATAPASPRSEFPGLSQGVSFGEPAGRAFPPAPAAVGKSSPPRAVDAAREDPLNAPFWVFLLWYMGSR